MAKLETREDARIYNERSLKALLRAIALSKGTFSLILVRCNYYQLREEIVQQLRSQGIDSQTTTNADTSTAEARGAAPAENHPGFREIYLDPNVRTLYTTMKVQLQGEHPGADPNQSTCDRPSRSTSALMVFGLESVRALDYVLSSTNQVREEFRKNFSCPLVLWVTSDVLTKMIRLAPDFRSWAASSIKFERSTEELWQELTQVADAVFQAGLAFGNIHWRHNLARNLGEGDENALGPTSDSTDWLNNSVVDLAIGSQTRAQVEAAIRDLRDRGVPLNGFEGLRLQASIQLVLGRDDYANDQLDAALEHYQQSLAFWSTAIERHGKTNEENTATNSPSDSESSQIQQPKQQTHSKEANTHAWQLPPIELLERQGVLLYHVALCYRRQADLKPPQQVEYLQAAKNYFQQCIEVFRNCQRWELVAQFSCSLGEVLRHLEAWHALETLANEALQMVDVCRNPLLRAQCYGFLAEVGLVNCRWIRSYHLAEEALSLANGEITHQQEGAAVPPQHKGLYLWLLGRALQAMNRLGEARQYLQQARETIAPQQDPKLYIRILETLRSIAFQQEYYLEAFRIEQQQHQIEHQFGFRAFIGAVQLQPQLHTLHPIGGTQTGTKTGVAGTDKGISANTNQPSSVARNQPVVRSDDQIEARREPFKPFDVAQGKPNRDATWAPEIDAAGRAADVRNLLSRLNRNDCKLTIIHGSSGVGKSSMLNAGLVPALKYRQMGDRIAVPIVVQVYTDWMGNAIKQLAELLSVEIPGSPPYSLDTFSSLLQQGQSRNLLIVLLFDQFEEFFFVCQQQSEQNLFCNFLNCCLNSPFVKVIISLREDYLHYLLSCEHTISLEAIGNNILDKNIRYPLRDLSPEKAKSTIENLTANSQFYMQGSLIDTLVQDLAEESGAVRPVELQVVGEQLQEEGIHTLKNYLQLGNNAKTRKQKLVLRSLSSAIEDCGPANEEITWKVLFSLIDDKGRRPLKTKREITASINGYANNTKEKLDLILEILVGSGLVFLHLEEPTNRYQLVHDYLVEPIQRKYNEKFQELKKQLAASQAAEKSSQKQLEKRNTELNRLLKITFGLIVLLLGATLSTATFWRNAEKQKQALEQQREQVELQKQRAERQGKIAKINEVKAEITAISANAEALLLDNKPLDALMEALRAQQRLQEFRDTISSLRRSSGPAQDNAFQKSQKPSVSQNQRFKNQFSKGIPNFSTADIELQVAAALQQAIYMEEKESNRLEGHRNAVWDVRFSDDGRLIASASNDKTVRVWQKNGAMVQVLDTPEASVTSVDFHLDGRWITAGDLKGNIYLWQRQHGQYQLVQTLSIDGKVYRVRFSPKGNLVAAGDRTQVQLWQRNEDGGYSQEPNQVLKGHGRIVRSVQFRRDGDWLATASSQGDLKLWQHRRNGQYQLQRNIDAHDGKINSVDFSPNGQFVASASDDKTIKLWNLQGKLLQTFSGHQEWVYSISFSPDGQSLVSASEDSKAILWDVASGKKKRTFDVHTDSVTSVDFSPNGGLVATGSWDKTVRLWKLKSPSWPHLSQHEDRVYSVSFSPDGKFLATGSRDQTIKIWNRQGQLQNSWQAHQERLYDVAFARENAMLASASHDCTVKLWERSGKAIATLTDPSLAQKSDLPSNCVRPATHADRVYEVAVDPKGELIATASRDQTVKIWTMQGKLLHTLTAHEGRVNSVAFSPDGKLLASAGDDQKIILFDRHGEKVRVVTSAGDDFGHQSYITDVTFSPNGKLLASAGWDNTVKLWRVSPTKSAGGQRSGSRQKAASKSDTTTNPSASLRTNPLFVDTLYRGYNDSVNSVAFRPDGKAIASANWDGTVKLWSRDGRLLKALHGHTSGVLDVSFRPDGNTLVSASADSRAILWNLALPDLLQKSCQWVRDYLATNPNLSQSDRALCDDINNYSQDNSQNHG